MKNNLVVSGIGNREKVMFIILGCACFFALAACSRNPSYQSNEAGASIVHESQTTSVEYVDAPQASAVTLAAQGWWAKDSYVDYGIKVTNANAGLTACNTRVHITLYDKSGAVESEYDDAIGEIGPGRTIGFAGEVGDGWTPTSVDIELVPGSTQWLDASDYTDPITVESCNEQNKLYFRYELTGYLTNNTPDYVSTVNLYALLFDDSGNIVAGYPAEAYKIKAGQTKSYLQTIDSAPDHASVELYTQVK